MSTSAYAKEISVMSMRPMTSLLLLCLLVVNGAGCASKYGAQMTEPTLYPTCYEPIRKLRSEENSSAKSTAAGAAIGAIGGALIGYAAGGGKGAAIGAASGAVAGGAAGYYYGEQQKIADENARMASYLRDLEGDISGLNATTASARMAIQCYQMKFNTALTQYKQGIITKPQLTAAYTEIKNGLTEAQNILGTVITEARDRDSQYQAAINEEYRVQGKPVPVAYPTDSRSKPTKKPSSKPKPAPASGSIDAVHDKAVAFHSGISDAQQTQKDANDFVTKMAENMS